MTTARSNAFAKHLTSQLDSAFRARLAGSWSTAEGHWPADAASESYSDVDVLVEPEQDARGLAEEIRACVLDSANRCGPAISRVSVRSLGDIQAFWSPRRVHAFARDQAACGNYMLFWALIGTLENLKDAGSQDDGKRSYAVAKFAFKLGRNLVLLRHGAPTDYARLCLQMHSYGFDARALRGAYDAKVGVSIGLSCTSCEALLGDTAWHSIEEALFDKNSRLLLARLRNKMVQWYKYGAPFDTQSLLDSLVRLDARPELEPARARALNAHG